MIRFLQTPGTLRKLILGGVMSFAGVAMVIYLIPGFLTTDASTERGILAQVGGQQVTLSEVQQQANLAARQQFPRGVPETIMPLFLQRAAEQIIVRKAMLAEASRLGLKVSDNELADELRHGPFATQIFPKGQRIAMEEYEGFVQSNFQMGVTQFEAAIQEDLLLRKLSSLIQSGITVSDADLENDYRSRNTKVKLQYAVLTPEEIAKLIHPTESELHAYFESNKSRYANAVPEKRKARYALISVTALQAQAPVTRDDLQRYYNERQDQFRVPEVVSVRHILIKTPAPGPDGKVDSRGVEAARDRAQDLLKQLKAGAKFEDLAKKYSEDPGSKDNGGLYEKVERGRMVAEFDKAAFSLPKGQLSDLVQTSFGFHIMRVEDHQSAHLRSLDEVKGEIEPTVAQEKAGRAAEALSRTLESEGRTLGLEKAAAKHGLPVVTTDYFGRGDSLPGVGTAPEFMETVFAAQKGAPPALARVEQGYALVELADVRPPATPTFEAIRSNVAGDFKQERVSSLLFTRTQELADRAHAEHDLARAARELGAKLETSELVAPEGQVPDIGQMTGQAAVAFTLKPGEISGPIRAGSNGVVLSVTERHEPSLADFEQSKDQIRERLLATRRADLLEVFIESLRERMKKDGRLKINQKEMDLITRSRGPLGGS
ncbi:MAG: peptidyl-prolyl cis-trans isomerase [Acidobacteriota bacterium]|nr:peptidyl-prolyl cis-trans isomerase [Acidobacteriota bacterium]